MARAPRGRLRSHDERAAERDPALDGGGADRPPYTDGLALAAWAWEHRSWIFGTLAQQGAAPYGSATGKAEITLRAFCDIAYTLIVNARVARGEGLNDVLEKLSKYA